MLFPLNRTNFLSDRFVYNQFNSTTSKMGSKKKILKKIDEIKHPNGRKNLQAIREVKKIKKRQNIKQQFASKANVEGKKLSFFAEKLESFDQSRDCLNPEEFEAMIESYFTRFDDELEQIELKVQVNRKHRQNQHSNRAGIINMTLKNEMGNFNGGGGIELPDLTDKTHFIKFKNWGGNSHDIQHLDIKFISRKYLNDLKLSASKNEAMQE